MFGALDMLIDVLLFLPRRFPKIACTILGVGIGAAIGAAGLHADLAAIAHQIKTVL